MCRPLHVNRNNIMTSLPIIAALCVPDRPASFRNRYDAKYWKQHLRDLMSQRQSDEIAIFGSLTISPPVEFPLSLDVLHLYANDHPKERDVDNTAKPIMDAFNGTLYNDDVQVKKLQFTSVHIFSEQAAMILAENNGFLGGLLSPLLYRAANQKVGNDVTLLVFRNLSVNLAETTGDYFLWKSKAGVQMNFG